MLEREESGGGGVEDVVGRMSLTLHQRGSIRFQSQCSSSLRQHNEQQGSSRDIECLLLPDDIWAPLQQSGIGYFGLTTYIPLEEESWAGRGVNDFDLRMWWTEDVERTRTRTW